MAQAPVGALRPVVEQYNPAVHGEQDVDEATEYEPAAQTSVIVLRPVVAQ